MFRINITSCITSASLAKRIFYTKYSFTKKGLFTPSMETDAYIRKGYTGGRCEAFYIGSYENVYYYDFTSLYPAVGRHPLPVGESRFITLDNIDELIKQPNCVGFVRCLVTSPSTNHLPLHGVKHENKLVFPILDEYELTLFTGEIKYGLKLGYTYKPIDAVIYQQECIMSNFFNDCFKNKQKAKKESEARHIPQSAKRYLEVGEVLFLIADIS